MDAEVKVNTEPVQTGKTNSSTPNRPAQKFRAGPIVATIWSNEGTARNGETTSYFTISLDRTYKDKDGAWQHTSSLRLHDLPRAQLVLQKAYEWLALAE